MVKTRKKLKWITRLWSIVVPGLFLAFPLTVSGQFSPPAGQPGSTAIHKDSAVFVRWAAGCSVQRGYVDISRPFLGLVSAGSCDDVIGKSGERGTLSLGDGGYAVLRFDPPVTNGPGWDFAVFENAFDDYFLELAFVEVSSDGENFFRFPNTSLTQTHTQVSSFGTLEAHKIHNLAGKYRLFYGVPFDLDTLKHTPGLDVNHITHIRVVDAVGSLKPDYARYDSHGNIINAPWPTPFQTGGFDLDAIGVINTDLSSQPEIQVSIRPNPIGNSGFIRIQLFHEGMLHVQIFDLFGSRAYHDNLYFTGGGHHDIYMKGLSLRNGMYLLHLSTGNMVHTEKLIFNNQP